MQSLSTGWHAAAFARSEKMQPLAEYLKPAPSFEEKREMGAVRLVAMLDRLERKSRRASKP